MSVEEIQSLRVEVAGIRESVGRIERALVGDAALGQKGFAERLGTVEAKADASDRKLLLWGGMATGASIVISVVAKIWDKIAG